MYSIGRRAFTRTLLFAAGLVFTAGCGNDLPTNAAKAPETSQRNLQVDPTAYYVIRNVATGKVMDVESAGCCNGYYVHQWTYEGKQNQQWSIVDLGNGYHRVVARHSGRVLDVSNRSMEDYARVHQWRWDGSLNQQFAFLFIDGTRWTIMARHSGKILAVSGGTNYWGSMDANGVGIRQVSTSNYGVWRLEKVQ